MNINKTIDGSTLKISLEGRLDTTTAPQLEAELKGSMDGVTELNMDFEKLEYTKQASDFFLYQNRCR